MGPVGFTAVGESGDRGALMAQAKLLAAAGIRVFRLDVGQGLVIRATDVERATLALGQADAVSSAAEPASSDSTLPERLLLFPLAAPPDLEIEIPGSKSHTNRALTCAALADGRTVLSRMLFADDTEAMLAAVGLLGCRVTQDRPRGQVSIEGPAMLRGAGDAENPDRTVVPVRQSGTTGRFLLPVLSALPGRFLLDGDPQLRARPFSPQIAALRSLGAAIEGERLPLVVDGKRLPGGSMTVSGSISSQFLSGLLLAAPLFDRPTTIAVSEGPLVSRPYVDLTVAVMADFGVDVTSSEGPEGPSFSVPAAPYQAANVELEPDASAASYFFAAAAITGGRVRINGLGASTVQGDLNFVRVLARMGASVEIAESWTEVRGTGELHGIEVDMSDISDTAQTLAVVASFADSPTTMTGIGFIRHKETDRIAAPVAELNRLGIRAEAAEDGMVVYPGTPHPGVVDTYDDHRMAMSFALLGLVHDGIEIDNPGCVAKTFPDFFAYLARLEGPASIGGFR